MDAPEKYSAEWCSHLHNDLEMQMGEMRRLLYGNGKEGLSVRMTKVEQVLPDIVEASKAFKKLYAQMIVVQTVILTIAIPIGVALVVNVIRK